MGGRDDTLLAAFDRLAALEPAARERELALLALDPDTERTLRDLLAADGDDDQGLRDALEQAARRLQDDVVPPTAAGARIGPWRVLREIGSGGMGTVFLAERADGAFAQQVAIKLLRGFPTEDGKRRLRREREILAALDHPHIARLLDGGETPDGQPYLVMEYVDGVPLTEWLAGAPARDARLALFDALCAAVAHAHRQLVVHRDLKPGNVLVRADGTPKLLDFGVARLADLDGETESTRVASAGWASPEQRAGGAITTASDVYSLGVLLRVLLGGRNDLDEAHAMPLADAELRGVVAMATAADPAARYPGVEALREDLVRWREGRPLKAARDSGWYRARKFIARHRIAVAAALVFSSATTLFVLGLQRAAEEARAGRAEAEAERVVAERVGDFMTGLFEDAAPANTGGVELSATEVARRGANALLSDASLPAAVRVRLLERLATTHINLQDLGTAAELLDAADRDRNGVSARMQSLLDHTRARVLARTGDLDGAQAVHDRARATLAASDADHDAWARLLQQGMWLANQRGEFRRTLALAQEALHHVALSREPDTGALTVLNSRSIAEANLGMDAETLATSRKAFDIALHAGDAKTTTRARVMFNLVSALRDQGRFDEASAALDTLERFARPSFAEDSREELVAVLAERARVESARGRGAEALAAIEEAIGIDSELPQRMRDPMLPRFRAEALGVVGRHAESMAVLVEVHGGPLPTSGPVDDWTSHLVAMASLAQCHLGLRDQARVHHAMASAVLESPTLASAHRQPLATRLARIPEDCRSRR